MIPPSDLRELTVKDYFDIVLKRIWIVILIVVVITGFIAFKSFSTPKIYQTQVKLYIGKTTPRVSGKEDIIYKGSPPTKEEMLNLLKSRVVAERVVKILNLLSDEEFIDVKDPAAKLIGMVSIDSPKDTNVVFLKVTGKSPLKITKIANTWAEEFIKVDIDNRASAAKYGVSWLKEQINETLKKLEDEEKKLNDFLKENRIVAIPDIGEQKEALLEKLKNQKSDLEKQILEASKKYGEMHPKMDSLRAQLEAIEQKLKEEQDLIYSLQEKSLQYKILRRNVDTLKSMYNDLLVRLKDLEMSKETIISNIQILDKATPPSKPIIPQPSKDITKALIFSVVFAISFCYFLEYIDSTLKTSEDVEFYTKMPFLGYIPSAKRDIRRSEKKEFISWIKPYSHTSEAFRNLRVSILFSFPADTSLKTIMITSSIAKEGKSFVSTNLAITFAQAKEETLLIDADMRKGRLEEIFDIKTKNGLSSLLAGMCSFDEAITTTPITNLYLMPRGPATPNPAELLSTQQIINVFEEAKKRFKRIILDAPPVMGVSDTVILGDKVDGIVFVIKSASTPLNIINEVRKILGKKIKIIGAVLNNIYVERDKYYSYYHYYHYSFKEK